MKRSLRSALCVLLVVLMLGLSACPSPDNGGGTTTPDVTTPDATTPSGATPDGPTTPSDTPTPDAPLATTFGDGAAISGTGDSIAAGAAILTATAYNAAEAAEKSLNQIATMFANNPKFSGIHKVNEAGAVRFSGVADKSYENNGAVIISADGFVFENCKNFTLSNITLVGPVSFVNCENVTLRGVQILAAGETAVKIDGESQKIYLRESRIEGATAIDNNAVDFYLLDSVIDYTAKGVADASEKNLYVRGCRFIGKGGAAILTASDEAEIRRSTFLLANDAIAGIQFGEVENVLVAECVFSGIQRAVLMVGAENAVIVRTSLVSAEVQNGKHIYVCDNTFGGKFYASDNSYILADGNKFAGDKLGYQDAGLVESIGNTNTNGDTLMDVTKRLAAGADENLLPHVDRDQYFGKTRKTIVRDPDGDMELTDYVLDRASEDEIVIVAPGAYVAYKVFFFRKGHSNTTLYAYGMLAERPATGAKDYNGDPLYGLIRVGDYSAGTGSENVTIKGGTYAYEYQGHAQGHIIKKVPGTNQVVLRASAGFVEDIGLSNEELFISTTYGYRVGNGWNYQDITHKDAELQDDGTVLMTLSATNWALTRVGDIVTTRPAHGAAAVNTDYSKNITYQDITVYGSMASVCFHEYYNQSSITYFRVADPYRSGMEITKEVYDAYKAEETKIRRSGNTDFTFEVWYDDEHDCYRGPAFRNASLDGVHVVSSAGGAQILSSLFERVGDDGTNELASYARLSSIHKIDETTFEIVYKGNLSVYWNQYAESDPTNYSRRWAHTFTQDFKPGNEIIIYTAGGGLVLEGVALEATDRSSYKVTNDIWESDMPNSYQYIETRRVKVRVTSYDESVLSDYLPYLDEYTADDNAIVDSIKNGPEEQYKVFVHNNSMGTRGVHIDNTKVTCGRARAALIKASDVIIENVTYEHIGMAAIGVYYEVQWGESAVSRNIIIRNNVLDHTGYRTNHIDPAPIAVLAPGTEVPGLAGAGELDKVSLYANVSITGNIIKNRSIKNESGRDCEYAISCNGVKDLVIANNDLGTIRTMAGNKKNPEDAGFFEPLTKTIKLERINGCRIEGNTYPSDVASVKSSFNFKNIQGLTGSDVAGLFPEFE